MSFGNSVVRTGKTRRPVNSLLRFPSRFGVCSLLPGIPRFVISTWTGARWQCLNCVRAILTDSLSTSGADSASNAISRLRRAVASDRTRDRQDDFRARWARQSPQRSLSAAQIEGAYGASMAIKQQQQQQQGLGVLSGARSLWRRMLTWSAIAFGLLTTLSLTITLSLATFSPKVAFASAPSSGVGGVETVVSRTV
eukprot:2548460-Rhodomonas_salina.2